MCEMKEKHDITFLTTSNRITTAEGTEEEYNARSFLTKFVNKMDDPYKICKAILDEMDCGKETFEKIYVEIQHEDAIWVMIYSITTDDQDAMEEIKGID